MAVPIVPVDPVRSDDPQKKKEDEKAKGTDEKDASKDKEGEGEELSEEDLQLRNELEMLVERLKVLACLCSVPRVYYSDKIRHRNPTRDSIDLRWKHYER